MITFHFSDGTQQVLRPTKAFYESAKGKKALSVEQKASDIAHDLGAVRYTVHGK